MSSYREFFPNATILPKMHILEDHVVEWMKRWKIGAGLMGEQGAESIHAHYRTTRDHILWNRQPTSKATLRV